MSTFTETYNLIKPGKEDYYDVQDFNENFDTIDAQMMQTEREISGLGVKLDSLDGKIGTDTENQTIFELLRRDKGEKFYQPSETARYSITQKQIVPRGSDSTNWSGKYKLLTFRAKHNGTIGLALKTNGNSDSNGVSFSVCGFAPKTYLDAPNTAAFTSDSSEAVLYSVDMARGVFDKTLLLPVSAGEIYTFLLSYSRMTFFTLETFKICYDEATAEEITEVVAA